MQIFWIPITHTTYAELFVKITELKKQTIVFTPNPEMLLQARDDREFAEILKRADYNTPDGIGLYLAFQILDRYSFFYVNLFFLPMYLLNLFFRRQALYDRYGERICGSDLTTDILYFAEEKSIPVVVIDRHNPSDEAKVLAQKYFREGVREQFPKLHLEYHVYNPEKKTEILQKIAQSKAQILFSTLGMKSQEQSVLQVMQHCQNIKLGLGVWSSFDYITGFQKRAPKSYRMLGLEWLYRLLFGARKIARMKRIWNAVFVFPYRVMKGK